VDRKLVKSIALVLSQNQGLTAVSLAKCFDTFAQTTADNSVLLQEESVFMEAICKSYKDTGSKPLALKSLRLGNGIYLSPSINKEAGSYLVSKTLNLI